MYTNPLTQESAPEGPNLLVGGRGSDWELAREWNKWHCSLQDPSHTHSVTRQQCELLCPGKHLSLRPLLPNRCMEMKKKMVQLKKQIKSLEKIQLSNEEMASLSDAQYKTLVIRMLQELTGYFNSIKKTLATMMVASCEIKKNL
ncbi:hypothetical protein HJG60_009316 [Phyllostomus discolor]|uniref:Uncharacterized protein n=1 Tax=Phyllostomus discolor TaxID=89673 RepID=A0A834D8P8_9CHIR|nr:hypothetical protein HJG60_009316 [Phyllostomus discolor]